MKMDNDVLVFLEPATDRGAEINQELLTEGSQIARQLGGSLSALAVEHPSESLEALREFGLTRVYTLHGAGLTRYSGETYAFAIAAVLKEIPFGLLLFAHSERGRELAPRVAFLLDTAAVTDCVSIRIQDQTVCFGKLLYGGQLEQEYVYQSRSRQIVSLSLEVMNRRKISESGELQIIPLPVAIPTNPAGTQIREIISPDYKTGDIAYATRIIGAGSGCATPRLLGLVEELAELLKGSIATTRPMVDDGLIARERMVGQTGKTVAPELYLALGISGSGHHVAGIQQSKMILSVNRDVAAPIFNAADAGFISDLEELLPRLINRIKQYRDEAV